MCGKCIKSLMPYNGKFCMISKCFILYRHGSFTEELGEILFPSIIDGVRKIENMVEGVISNAQDMHQNIPRDMATSTLAHHENIIHEYEDDNISDHVVPSFIDRHAVTDIFAVTEKTSKETWENANDYELDLLKCPQPQCSYDDLEDEKIVPITQKQTIKNKIPPKKRLKSGGSLTRIDC